MSNNLQKYDTPEYVLQPNVISQAIYNLGPYARKLIALAMSLISPDNEEYTVSFTATDFIKAMGFESQKESGELKKYIKAAVRECLDSHIEINEPNGDWAGYTWFTESLLKDYKSETDWGWGKITMTFNPKLGDTIKAFKKAYAKINLADLGKLQSRYAIRIYELALSYAGFAGKEGNRHGEWFFEKSLADLRILFQIDKKKYKVTKDFRVYVIDRPIEEINNAGIGLRIEPEYKRRGRFLIGVRFNCRWMKRDDPKPTAPATETGQEDDALINTYPEEYETLKAQVLEKIKKGELQFNIPGLEEQRAEAEAIRQLKENYPDFSNLKNSPKRH